MNETPHSDICGNLQRIYSMTGIFSVFLLMICSLAGCEKSIPVPQQLIGEWTTSAPQYEDRYLKIAEHSLTFGIGEGEAVSHDIEKVTAAQENGGTVYTFHYKDQEGEASSLALTYSTEGGGTIKLKHSNVLWEKVTAETPS